MAKLTVKEGEVKHGILNTKKSHWGLGQTGVGLCEDGRVDISNNQKVKDEFGDWDHPTHRDLKCPYPAIYAFGYNNGKNIWLYPSTESNIDKVKKAICNLKGKRGITEDHIIMSNRSRKAIGKVGKFCKL